MTESGHELPGRLAQGKKADIVLLKNDESPAMYPLLPPLRQPRLPGGQAWRESLTPEIPSTERIPNPYTYTDFDGGDARHRAKAED